MPQAIMHSICVRLNLKGFGVGDRQSKTALSLLGTACSQTLFTVILFFEELFLRTMQTGSIYEGLKGHHKDENHI